jgi:polyisoprenoid-binding protein YceI
MTTKSRNPAEEEVLSIRNIGFLTLAMAIILSACGTGATQESATEAPEVIEAEAPELEGETESSDESETSSAEGETVFTLDPELTEARFIIGEILANSPNTVVGVNKLVQGGGVLNTIEPSLSTLDEFVIDAAGFVTDANLRNRAISQFILQSSQYPFIRFEPTSIAGLPTEITIGDPVAFEVSGFLTIREITQEVIFVGEATMVAEDRVEGLASATVFREDFELSIPSVPRVAGVDEEFTLEIEFVAVSG